MEKIETATALIDDPTLDEFLSEEFKNRKNYKYAMYFVLDSDFRENYLNNQERAESLFLTLNLIILSIFLTLDKILLKNAW